MKKRPSLLAKLYALILISAGLTAQAGVCTSPIFTTSDPNGGLGFDIDGNGTEDYYVHNHLWNAANYPGTTGTTAICNYNSWRHTAVANNNNGDGAVKTYPNTHRDYSPERALSNMPVITSTFGFTAPGNGIYNVAYDIWLNNFAYEIMIWTENRNQRPGGNIVASNLSISGYTWDFWKSGTGYLAFAAPLDPATGRPSHRIISSGNFDIKAFLNWLISNGHVPSSATMRQLDFGVEIVSTDGVSRVFDLTDFSITDTGSPPSPPSAPSGLGATAVSSSQINLAWTDNSGNETGFKIERKTGAGGTYSQIATVGANVSNYNNTGLTASTQYFYRVRANNANGDSAYSNEANATTQTAGGGTGSNLALNRPVAATGWEFDGSTPQPPEQAVDGNATTIWKSRNLDNEWIYVDLGGSKSINQVGLKWDWSYPSAYKIQYSTQASNPTTWTDVYSTTTFTGGNVTNSFSPVNATFCRLLCVTRAVLFSQQWQNKLFEFEVYGPPSLPSPWQSQDIGAVAAAGSATASGGTFTVVGSGADIFGTADEFRYVYQTATGDCEIKARVTAVQNTNPWAKAGVMIRESLTAGSKHIFADVSAASGGEKIWRASTGGTSPQTVDSTIAVPIWLRVQRTGNLFSAYKSTNGTTWTQIGTATTITMGTSVYIGLAATAHNDGALCTSTFDNVTATP